MPVNLTCNSCNTADFEIKIAQEDVRRTVCKYGKRVDFQGLPALPVIGDPPPIGETEITRDKYGSIIDRSPTTVSFNAFPIDMSPSSKQLNNVGMVEQMDSILYLSTKEVEMAGYSFEDFDLLKTTVIIDNVEYKLKDRKRHSQFKDQYLYITLGLRRN